MNTLALVSEFHAAFRYKQPESRTPDLQDKATNELRPRLLREEMDELRQAIADNNRVEELDALCDLQYVLSGAVLAWGLRGLFEATTCTIELRKIRDLDRHIAAMDGMITQMETAAEMNYPPQVLSCLLAMESKLRTLVYHFGFAPVFTDAFKEVHRSNLSKLFDTPDHDERVHQFDNAGNGKWIGRRLDGKIVKSLTYSPADLSRFV